MSGKSLAGVAAGALIAAGAQAGAVTLIDFDHVTHQLSAPLPNFYDHVSWLGAQVIAADYVNAPEGLFNSVVSPDYVAAPNGELLGEPAMAFGGTSFTFQDAYFGSWSRDGMTLDVAGVDRAGNVVDTTSFTVDTLGPTFETFNWSNLYAVFIVSEGDGVENPNDGGLDSPLFAVDNVRLTNVVPEPGALALLGLGLGGLALRRRRAR